MGGDGLAVRLAGVGGFGEQKRGWWSEKGAMWHKVRWNL